MANAGRTTYLTPEKRAIIPFAAKRACLRPQCMVVVSCRLLSPVPLKRRECPQDYMVERPAQSWKARVRIPVPCERNSSAIVLHPIVALLLEFYGECRWEYIGNQRIRIPPGWPRGQPRILIKPCRHFAVRFCDECRWNYILKEDEIRVQIPVAPTDGVVA